MKTSACHLVAYGETTGGPVCICSFEAAIHWQGAEQEESLYWEVVEKIGLVTLFQYSPEYAFFNTETGNFALYKAVDALVVVEIISIENAVLLPEHSVKFTIRPQTYSPVQLRGITCFFDAAVTVNGSILPQESVCHIGQSSTWDTVVLECDYHAAYEVSFESDLMHLEGVCFLREAI